MDICSIVDLSGLQGHKLFHHVFSTRFENLCSSTWITFSPLLLTLVSAGLTLSSLSQLLLDDFFLPSLDYVITGALLLLLFSSALASSESVLQPSESGSLWDGRSFWKLTEANPVAPLLPSWYRSTGQWSPSFSCLQYFVKCRWGFL